MLALPVACVVETMRPLPVDVAADADGAVLGTARIRGERCAVIDAARLLGVPGEGAARRFLVVRGARGRVALLVDDVLAVRPADGAPVDARAALANAGVGDALREVLARARWLAANEAAPAAGEGAR